MSKKANADLRADKEVGEWFQTIRGITIITGRIYQYMTVPGTFITTMTMMMTTFKDTVKYINICWTGLYQSHMIYMNYFPTKYRHNSSGQFLLLNN